MDSAPEVLFPRVVASRDLRDLNPVEQREENGQVFL